MTGLPPHLTPSPKQSRYTHLGQVPALLLFLVSTQHTRRWTFPSFLHGLSIWAHFRGVSFSSLLASLLKWAQVHPGLSINPFLELVSPLRQLSQCSDTWLPNAFACVWSQWKDVQKCQIFDTLPFLIISCQLPKTETSHFSLLPGQELDLNGFAGNSNNHFFRCLLLCNLRWQWVSWKNFPTESFS